MTGTLKNVSCRKEKQFMQAISEVDQSGCLEVLKQSTGPASFSFQLEEGRLLRRHQDHLIPRSNVIQEPIGDQEVPPTTGQLKSQNYSQKNSWCSQLSLCNQLLKTSQKSAILLETDKHLDIWLILLLSDLLCYKTETLKNCKLSFLLMLL